MTDEEDDEAYYEAMFWSSIVWTVGLIVFFGVIAWIC